MEVWTLAEGKKWSATCTDIAVFGRKLRKVRQKAGYVMRQNMFCMEGNGTRNVCVCVFAVY